MQDYFAQDTDTQHIYVLHGLGGAGKTQLALKFIQDSSRFSNTFFVDASTVETIDTGFKHIGKLLSVGDSSEDTVKWLVAQHENWLVFFDNADDPKLNLHKFLPQCNHGNIIITSRNPELRVYGSDSSVSGMEQEEAITLLLKSGAVQQITLSDEKTAADIVKVLWYLPLAIVQAGAFIAKFRALDQYLDLYAKNHNRLLREKPSQSHSDYEWTVYTTWQMSFDQLSPAAAMFLQLYSFLHREGISEDIFSRAADYNFPSFGPSKEELQEPLKFLSQFQGPDGQWDTLAFLELTTEIMSFSLVTFEPENRTFSIHPLVHQWSRDTLADPESNYYIAYSVIGMSIWGIPEIHSQLASLKVLPHVDAIMQFKEFVGPDFSADYGLLYFWADRFQEAKALRVSALERWRTLKNNDNLDTLYLMHSLGVTYSRLGQLKEAEELQIVVLDRRRAILGEDHPETLKAIHNLADTYMELGQLQKAEELELVVVEKRRAILGADHRHTLSAMRNLTITYRRLGQLEKAEELGLVVVEKRGAMLGEDHLETLDAMYHLEITYRELGQFQQAKELGLVVVEKRSTVLGVDHLATLEAIHNLAVTYQKLSQFDDAQRLQTEVLPKFRTILGDDHPYTLQSISSLAHTYRALGKVVEAWDLEALPHEAGTSASQASE
ncbi:P-loop containing nucleoside triphosphate hydrolase protein [Mycena metata]|uniref:P-loop containing nucleoside triphosphate hydrolase protein n=1 Tax=Mycena metata TaxID=1033252 RepID=A0AAD7MQ18_9AGAR|nr:P-loop containing nucleoside triphosphate hydrolase protein [Mycena metata]